MLKFPATLSVPDSMWPEFQVKVPATFKVDDVVKWRAQLGSRSYAGPIVAGGKIFVGTNNENPRDPQHQGDRSILMCFDEKTGAFLWQLVVPKLASGKVNDWENLGLLSSPTVEGNRVKFDLKVVKPLKITLKYDLTVEGDKLTGKVKMGIFGSAKLMGERVRETVEA